MLRRDVDGSGCASTRRWDIVDGPTRPDNSMAFRRVKTPMQQFTIRAWVDVSTCALVDRKTRAPSSHGQHFHPTFETKKKNK